jgi:hypothetical protein
MAPGNTQFGVDVEKIGSSDCEEKVHALIGAANPGALRTHAS